LSPFLTFQMSILSSSTSNPCHNRIPNVRYLYNTEGGHFTLKIMKIKKAPVLAGAFGSKVLSSKLNV
jgi:hypothetical protein